MVDDLKQKLDSHREDLAVIAANIPPKVTVLDLGCGDGTLLQLLQQEKDVDGLGVEVSQEKLIECVTAGVPVLHGDLNKGLTDFNTKSFDYVILSQTLQAVRRPDELLEEMLRVGEQVIISFLNIGYYSARFQLFFQGKMPCTKSLPHKWYQTPNIHLGTIDDFRMLCREKDITIQKEIAIGNSPFLANLWPNLFSKTTVFIIKNQK